VNAALWNRTAVDFAVLPAELLDLQKQHSRVIHARDDDLIKRYIAIAIGIVERRANINVVPATYKSTGATLSQSIGYPCCWCAQFSSWGYLLPFNNVREARLLDAADTDVTGAWVVAQQEFGANRDAYLLDPASAMQLPTGVSLELDVGCETSIDFDPVVLALVLRLVASLYEYREADLALTESSFAPELAQIWRPCA
jgi:hypothetical protein